MFTVSAHKKSDEIIFHGAKSLTEEQRVEAHKLLDEALDVLDEKIYAALDVERWVPLSELRKMMQQ